jgi:hypothetical protein
VTGDRNIRLDRISLRAPAIFLVFAAIVIPVEFLRAGHHGSIDFAFDHFSHALVNVLGFIPVGVALGEFGILWAVVAGALMSGFAETSQLVMLYRDSSVGDFLTNTLGAFLGAVIAAHWNIRSPSLKINKWTTLLAAVISCGLMAQIWAEKGPVVNTRGSTSPGNLEANWKLDGTSGQVALDSSGHGLNGRFNAAPRLVPGATGSSVVFDGDNLYVDFGRSTALRLAGSMTITAWINSSSFPYDDAAIVSQLHDRFGFQFDTTIDKGPRTVGFKLSNACGNLMARYGSTTLVLGTWYHVAGVYDSARRTLDIYLNGKLDDGPSVGSVTSAQHSSRRPVYVGKRSDQEGFGFAGSIRDVRIYSFALTNSEIAAVMQGEPVDGTATNRDAGSRMNARSAASAANTDQNPSCAVVSESGDQWIPLIAAGLGVLVAIACIGLWPSANSLLYLFSSFAAGLLLLPAIAPNVPSFNLWLTPLVALAGGMVVVVSAYDHSTGRKKKTAASV